MCVFVCLGVRDQNWRLRPSGGEEAAFSATPPPSLSTPPLLPLSAPGSRTSEDPIFHPSPPTPQVSDSSLSTPSLSRIYFLFSMFNGGPGSRGPAKGPPPALPPKPAKFRKYKARAMPAGSVAAGQRPGLPGGKPSSAGLGQERPGRTAGAQGGAPGSFKTGPRPAAVAGERFTWVTSIAAFGRPPMFVGSEKMYPSRNADAAYEGTRYLIKHDTASSLRPASLGCGGCTPGVVCAHETHPLARADLSLSAYTRKR